MSETDYTEYELEPKSSWNNLQRDVTIYSHATVLQTWGSQQEPNSAQYSGSLRQPRISFRQGNGASPRWVAGKGTLASLESANNLESISTSLQYLRLGEDGTEHGTQDRCYNLRVSGHVEEMDASYVLRRVRPNAGRGGGGD